MCPRFAGSSRTSHSLPLHSTMGVRGMKRNRDETSNAARFLTVRHAASPTSANEPLRSAITFAIFLQPHLVSPDLMTMCGG